MMKKILLITVLAVFGCTTSNAQEETTTGGFANGDIFVGGSLGFNSNTQDGSKNNGFNISPSIGYFLSDKIAAEFSLSIGYSKFENEEFESTNSSFGANLGATYFFTPASKFSFTIGSDVFYMRRTSDTSSLNEEITSNSFGIVASPGINYFISNNFSLRTSLGALSYSRSKEDLPEAKASNNLRFNLSLSNINFGVIYKF